MLVEFEPVKLRVKKSGKCLCGKRRVRSSIFEMTLNPWNKNEKGEVRTRDEIWECLKKQAEEWKKEPITCDECRPDLSRNNQ